MMTKRVVGVRWTVLCFAACLICTMASSRAQAQQCVGDCDANGSVSVSELVRCVRIALGQADTASCPECDQNGDGSVRIPELITAVSHALCACETCPTPVPTRTPTFTNTAAPATATPPPATQPPATSTPAAGNCDFNGRWDGQSTTVRDSCDDDFDSEPFSLTIAHDGNGVLTAPAGFQGAVDSTGGTCCLDFDFIEPDEGGISCNVGRICQTADGRQFTGSIAWRFYESAAAQCSDNDFECAGEESLSATRR